VYERALYIGSSSPPGVCGSVSLANELDAEDRYSLGRYAGAALAGATMHSSGRGVRDELPDHLVEMIARLDGDEHPRELAAQLVGELGGWVTPNDGA
jgi:hypothetical protein